MARKFTEAAIAGIGATEFSKESGRSELQLAATMLLGLVLPFIAGLWGTVSLYEGFLQMCDTMPPGRAARRGCFLRRLVLSWSACYSAVMPVMIYSLWEVFSRV